MKKIIRFEVIIYLVILFFLGCLIYLSFNPLINASPFVTLLIKVLCILIPFIPYALFTLDYTDKHHDRWIKTSLRLALPQLVYSTSLVMYRVFCRTQEDFTWDLAMKIIGTSLLYVVATQLAILLVVWLIQKTKYDVPKVVALVVLSTFLYTAALLYII